MWRVLSRLKFGGSVVPALASYQIRLALEAASRQLPAFLPRQSQTSTLILHRGNNNPDEVDDD